MSFKFVRRDRQVTSLGDRLSLLVTLRNEMEDLVAEAELFLAMAKASNSDILMVQAIDVISLGEEILGMYQDIKGEVLAYHKNLVNKEEKQ